MSHGLADLAVLFVQAPAKKRKTQRQKMEKMYGHRRLPIRAKVSISSQHRKSQIFLLFYMSSIFKVAVSAQGCCHFINGPHFKVHQDQRPQQKIRVYDNYRYFHLFRIESLCSLGQNWGRATQCHKKHVQDWISDNLQAYSTLTCIAVNYWRCTEIVQTEELTLNLPSFHSSNCEIEIKQYGNDFKFVLCVSAHERERSGGCA